MTSTNPFLDLDDVPAPEPAPVVTPEPEQAAQEPEADRAVEPDQTTEDTSAFAALVNAQLDQVDEELETDDTDSEPKAVDPEVEHEPVQDPDAPTPYGGEPAELDCDTVPPVAEAVPVDLPEPEAIVAVDDTASQSPVELPASRVAPSRLPLLVGGALLVVAIGGVAWWTLSSKESAVPPAPVVSAPVPEVVEPAPVIAPQPTPQPVAVEPAPVPVAVVAPEPKPVASEPVPKAAQPKATPKPAGKKVAKPAPKPQPEPAPNWQDNAMDQLDALEKRL